MIAWCRTVKTVKRQNRFLRIENFRINSSWLKTKLHNSANFKYSEHSIKSKNTINSQTSKTTKKFFFFKILPPEAEVKKLLIEQEDGTGLPGWEKIM